MAGPQPAGATGESGRVRGGCDRAFVIEQPALEFLAKTEAGEGTVGPDHPMTGYEKADGIGRIRPADRARSRRVSNPTGYFTVGSGRPKGDFCQGRPDLLLEWRTSRRQGDGEFAPTARAISQHLPASGTGPRFVRFEATAAELRAERRPSAKGGGSDGAGCVHRHAEWAEWSFKRAEIIGHAGEG